MCVADTPIEKKRYHLIKLKIQPQISRGPWCVQILASLRSARIFYYLIDRWKCVNLGLGHGSRKSSLIKSNLPD